MNSNNLFKNEADRTIALGESEKPFAFYNKSVKNNVKSSTLENLWPTDVDDLLTSKQKDILTEMNTILSNSSLTIQEIIEALNTLEVKINSECSIEERNVLLCATSIGRYSFQYWHDNFDKWENEFGTIYNLKNTQKFSWSDVGKNDVAYGVGGGVAGAIVGGSVSIGILTAPGWVAGAIGGAVGGSIGNAILQLW